MSWSAVVTGALSSAFHPPLFPLKKAKKKLRAMYKNMHFLPSRIVAASLPTFSIQVSI